MLSLPRLQRRRVVSACPKCGRAWADHQELWDETGGVGYLCRMPAGSVGEVHPPGYPGWALAAVAFACLMAGPTAFWLLEEAQRWLMAGR